MITFEVEQVGNTGLNIAIFTAFVAVTMVFVLRASRTKQDASEMYTAGAGFSGVRRARSTSASSKFASIKR